MQTTVDSCKRVSKKSTRKMVDSETLAFFTSLLCNQHQIRADNFHRYPSGYEALIMECHQSARDQLFDHLN